MGNLISKFNLYELFRILLPGFYLVYLFYELFKDYFINKSGLTEWPIVTLIVVIFSLIIGTIIYSLDFCRLFKNVIKNIPTNLMTENYPQLYPKSKERENEHKYYEWYENAELNSKTKTELQSSLYHLSINIAFVALIGISVGLVILSKDCSSWFYIISNIILFFLSLISACCIIKRRLKYQWQRNYWEFEEAIIKPLLKK